MECGLAPDRIGAQQHLAVGLGVENLSFSSKRVTQFNIVIKLAIEDQVIAACRIRHWLQARLTNINDGQPPVSEGNWSGRRVPFTPSCTIRAAMGDQIDALPVGCKTDRAKNPAHSPGLAFRIY